MKVAVLTLTRDRLDYTRHCFDRLRALAGCSFDHYVLDQGSTDGTADWLYTEWWDGHVYEMIRESENIGVNAGINRLLDRAAELGTYDAIVKVDNDCELVRPDTLRACAWVASTYNVLCSPRIEGLRNPVPASGVQIECGFHALNVTSIIGGIFLAAPASLYQEGYRHDESAPPWGSDDRDLCAWWLGQGRSVGYLDGYVANHYETTDGQHARFPGYFERRVQEGGPE